MKQTRFAIFDPDQCKFLSVESSFTALVWTDKVQNVWSNVAYDKYPNRLERVIHRHPNAYIAEIDVTITWKRANHTEVSLEVRYAKEIELYNTLLPKFEMDADSMSKPEWNKFRIVRAKLRSLGFNVVGGIGPTPQIITFT